MNIYIQICFAFVQNDRGCLIMRSFIFKFAFKPRPPSYVYHNTHEPRMMHSNEVSLLIWGILKTPSPPRGLNWWWNHEVHIYIYIYIYIYVFPWCTCAVKLLLEWKVQDFPANPRCTVIWLYRIVALETHKCVALCHRVLQCDSDCTENFILKYTNRVGQLRSEHARWA